MRKEHGWSQAQAAAQFGISLRAWQYYEANTRLVPRPIIRRVVEILNGREPNHAGESFT
jgi:transcriptional regulator with XRE-family HTH domain